MQSTGLRQNFSSLKKRFLDGDLDRYAYLSERHEFNKLFLEYASQIKNSEIESIKILPDSVVFTFKPLGIELETEGAARSAPFEILNFGSYEPEDEFLAYQLIKNGDVILDIGTNIGWYTTNFAKKFPRSTVYGFEPIQPTYELLCKNVARNRLKNAILFNYGLSNKEEEKFLYYFRGGSSIASVENLVNNPNAIKMQCLFRTVDAVVNELKLNSVDFIKCDVEGSELPALQGAVKTIERHKPILLVEVYQEWCDKCGYTAMDIVNLLTSRGYEIFEAVNRKLRKVESIRLEDDGSGRYNYFFLDPKKHRDVISKLAG